MSHEPHGVAIAGNPTVSSRKPPNIIVPHYWHCVTGIHHWQVDSPQNGIIMPQKVPCHYVIIHKYIFLWNIYEIDQWNYDGWGYVSVCRISRWVLYSAFGMIHPPFCYLYHIMNTWLQHNCIRLTNTVNALFYAVQTFTLCKTFRRIATMIWNLNLTKW